jgi:predicted site-specific integrase-resolvase
VGKSGKYRYDVDTLVKKNKNHQSEQTRKGIIYARVSTRKQSTFLQNQIDRLKAKYPDHDVLSDVASGLNFKRKGFRKLLERCMSGGVSEVCVAHKDRLCRFAFDLVEQVLRKHGTGIIVDEHRAEADTTAEAELGDDIISIITVFGARLHGARGGRRKHRAGGAKQKETEDDRGSVSINGGTGGGVEAQANEA